MQKQITADKVAVNMFGAQFKIRFICGGGYGELGLPARGRGFHLIPFRTQKLNRVPFPTVVRS